MRLPRGTIKRIHVNQHVIRSNIKGGEDEPAMTVQTSKGVYRGREVRILGTSKLVQCCGKALSCGARVWIETRAAVQVINRKSAA